jgi:amidase
VRVIQADRVISTYGVHEPAATVRPGDEFWVETRDCYDGQVHSEKDLRGALDASRFMPMTGPILVEGAQPGNSLRIEILAIELAEQGAMPLRPGMGLLGSQVPKEHTVVFSLHPADGLLRLGPFAIPLHPMIGSIGTAPADTQVPSSHPGPHGGNLDAREVGPGNVLNLPVFVRGALLALGDLHAAMGDGEMNGLGVECAGRVRMRVTVLPETLRCPRLETPEAWIFFGVGATLEEALRVAAAEAVEFIRRQYRVDFELAYRVLTMACHAGIAAVVNPKMTAKVTVPKGLAEGARR